jgi:hypothetical protein
MCTLPLFYLDVSVLCLHTPAPFGISCCLDGQIIQGDAEAAVSHSPKNHKAQTLQVTVVQMAGLSRVLIARSDDLFCCHFDIVLCNLRYLVNV